MSEFIEKLITLNPSLDDRDRTILIQRATVFNNHQTPRVGDFVRFPDLPTLRRFSYLWFDEQIQSSDGGSFYLGDGFVSFSGSLYQSVPVSAMTLGPETENGQFWFFHHNYAMASNGVGVSVPCRIWTCNINAPRS